VTLQWWIASLWLAHDAEHVRAANDDGRQAAGVRLKGVPPPSARVRRLPAACQPKGERT